MPTKNPTKPKRQNWKALANHRAGALIVMADVNRAQSEKITELLRQRNAAYKGVKEREVMLGDAGKQLSGLIAAIRESLPDYPGLVQEEWHDNLRRGVGGLRKRAESAEKHNAILLAEKDARSSNTFFWPIPEGVSYGGDVFTFGDVVDTPQGRFTICDSNKTAEPEPTRLRRFQARTASLSRRVWDFIRRR